MRQELYDAFRAGEIPVLVVSKVANFSIDLPQARVAIQVSGTFGSRQEEASASVGFCGPRRTAGRRISTPSSPATPSTRTSPPTASDSWPSRVTPTESWTPTTSRPGVAGQRPAGWPRCASDKPVHASTPLPQNGRGRHGCSVTDPFTGHLMAIGVDIPRRLCTEWSRKGNDLITKQGKGCHMVLNETFEIQGQRVGGSPVQHELNDTADRLVLDVVAAVDDGYTGVPECHRLTAWLSAEFIPYVAPGSRNLRQTCRSCTQSSMTCTVPTGWMLLNCLCGRDL